MASQTFSSWEEFKEKNADYYTRLDSAAKGRFWSMVDNCLSDDGRKVQKNPHLLTLEQWRFFALQSIDRGILLSEVLEGFDYCTDIVVVESERYYCPNGNVSGWLGGIFLFVERDGRAHS